ncbi:hypothetical protein AX15_002028 [Amanita polypyramis BW_CC]|nr:hypothetical protein AX15_002028 [Amanita polypyramis BW_CC]
MADRGRGRGRGGGGGGGPHRGGSFQGPPRGSSPSRGYGGQSRGGPSGFDGRGRGRGRGGGGTRDNEPEGPPFYPHGERPSLPPRLTDNSQDKLIKDFKSVSYQAKRPLRPGYGTLGTPILLRANYFAMKLPKGPFYDYAVTITESATSSGTTTAAKKGGKGRGRGKPKGQSGDEPSGVKAPIKRRIFQLLEDDPGFKSYVPHVVHDYSQRVVSAKKLPQPLKMDVTFMEEDETRPSDNAPVYEVSVDFLNELDLNTMNRFTEGDLQYRDYDLQPVTSALNLVLQFHASRSGVRVGRKENNGESKFFFDTGEFRRQLAPGVRVWQGFFISVRPAFKQLMVNVNVCYTAFMEHGNLADVLLNSGMHLSHDLVDSIKVKTKHLKHKKNLHMIGTTTARDTFFQCAEFGNAKISVEQYFRRKYNITLKHASDLPVVSLGEIVKDGVKGHIWVPAELCDIVRGSPRRGRLTDDETREMIRIACRRPGTNAMNIVETGLPSLGFSRQKAPILATFGIDIDTKMASISGRVLPPPRLTYRQGNASMKDGAWNILSVKFHRGAQIKSWWVVHVRDKYRDAPDSSKLVLDFKNKCAACGMEVPQSKPQITSVNLMEIRDDDKFRTKALTRIYDTFSQGKEKFGRPTFVLVLLEREDKHIYPGIKRMGDVLLGIHTVHMLLDKALHKGDQYLSNVALKVNTKLGGVNHKLDDGAMQWLRKKSTMMVGIDVTHAGPGSKLGTPSIAAVVASIDDSFVHFPASIRIQKHERNKETLDELRDMMVERLKAYEGHNRGRLPERVFIFRDGVSEGQFNILLVEELPQILKAFENVKANYRPLLSIVVCGKRHHARPYATDSAHADKNGNTRPGTVIDRGITSVFDFDFYLQAHAGLQGTVKMTHYTVIYDETRFGPDEIQQGANTISYLYGRATRSVSLIPPAYYADLACERGRYYLNKFLIADEKANVAVRSGKADRETEMKRVFEEVRKYWGHGLHEDMKGSMFYL